MSKKVNTTTPVATLNEVAQPAPAYMEVLNDFILGEETLDLTKVSDTLSFITSQIEKFGKEKHIAFLKKVFHNTKVSQEQFFKVLKDLQAKITAKETNATTPKAPKQVVAKATKRKQAVVKETTTPKASKQEVAKATKKDENSIVDLNELKNNIASLVRKYNDKWNGRAKVEVDINYVILSNQTIKIR